MPTKGKTWKWSKEKLVNHVSAGKYIGIDRRYIYYFRWARWRAMKGQCQSFYWEPGRAGMLGFIAEIGAIPDDMIRPSVGRIDHKKGYEPGNVRWEEFNYNARKRIHNQDRFISRNANQPLKGSKEDDIPF